MSDFCEVWAVPKDRLESFFAGLGMPLKEDSYSSEELNVSVKYFDTIVLCGQDVQRYRVSISGKDPDAEILHKKFVLTFLSAGG